MTITYSSVINCLHSSLTAAQQQINCNNNINKKNNINDSKKVMVYNIKMYKYDIFIKPVKHSINKLLLYTVQ